MMWTTFPFGKHQGKTLPQIVLDDPDWFFWILPELDGHLKIEAHDLARKASKIKIPRKNPRKWRGRISFCTPEPILRVRTCPRGQLHGSEMVDQTAVPGFETATVSQGI